MLNGRLYLQAWFVAVVALLVAFLTLQPSDEPYEAEQLAVFNGSDTTRAAQEFLQAAPLRVPGSVGAEAGTEWVSEQLRSLPGGERLVATQEATVMVDGRRVPITNVLFTMPAAAPNKSQRNILVVAPRDAPRQVTGGSSSTAILVELARLSVRAKYRHPIVFVSVDGDTVGNAGLRWYLSTVDTRRIAGAVILDAPGEGQGTTIDIWASGAGRQALGMRALAEQAVRGAGFEPSVAPPLRAQLIQQAVPETRGAQRPAIDRGVPAVTLAGRPESPLPIGVQTPQVDRVRAAGTAALNLLALLDERERAKAPDASFAYAGRILRPSVVRLALLLLALPLFVMALDAAARIRRARVRLSAGLRAVTWRLAPPMLALVTGYVLTLLGVLRPPDVGMPPLPAEIPFEGQAILGSLLAVLLGAGAWLVVRPRVAATGANVPAEAAGALLVLSAATLVAWWKAPFALVLILPAAHAALAATLVPRRWQVGALAAVAIVAPVAVVANVAAVADRGLWATLWYLFATSVSGARGFLGPILLVVVATCVVSLAAMVLFRARKGLVRPGRREGVVRRASNLSARKRPAGS